MVSKLDESVGHIVHTLMETGMLNNSIIIFISDNGAPSVGEFQNWGSNYPLRGVRILVYYRQLTRRELLELTVA
jgi:arylsulfatase A-like enzyme